MKAMANMYENPIVPVMQRKKFVCPILLPTTSDNKLLKIVLCIQLLVEENIKSQDN